MFGLLGFREQQLAVFNGDQPGDRLWKRKVCLRGHSWIGSDRGWLPIEFGYREHASSPGTVELDDGPPRIRRDRLRTQAQ